MLLTLLACIPKSTPPADTPSTQRIRVATYNASLFGDTPTDVLDRLQDGSDTQGERVAGVVDAAGADILILQELDHDEDGALLAAFNALLAEPYPYTWHAPSNTGVPTGRDLDHDGATDGPGDAQGYGTHPGQYAFAVLSRYPLDQDSLRTWQTLLWQDMPDARLPSDGDDPWYSEEDLALLRLSSKNHVDVPVTVGSTTLHLLSAHPTPPVFDGDEDRNGLRNADEIRLLAEIIEGADWLRDDQGGSEGLSEDDAFVVFGDMNADPVDGDSVDGAIQQLLEHPRVHADTATGALVPSSDGAVAADSRPDDQGDPAHDTAGWGQRVDYVLPSADLDPVASGVWWPEGDRSIEGSDHRLVWVDLEL